MPSVGALITGLPEAGLVVNYQPASRKPFPTSIAAVFRRLGYRTRAFYAGYLSWQRFGDFCAEQGFEEIHGGGDMDQSGLLKREWGVEDDKLFDYVARHVPAEPPSFNLILSAGYHPPYTMDVWARGYPVRQNARRAAQPVSEDAGPEGAGALVVGRPVPEQLRAADRVPAARSGPGGHRRPLVPALHP
jgi:hypothetical protein